MPPIRPRRYTPPMRRCLLVIPLLLAACATPRPVLVPSEPDTPVPDWCAALTGRFAWESSPDRALYDHGGRLGLYENPGENEVGLGKAAFLFSDATRPVLDGAQLGLLDHTTGALHFLLPGEPGSRSLTHAPHAIIQSATSGPFHVQARTSFAALDTAVLSLEVVNSGSRPVPITPLFRLRTVADESARAFRWIPERNYALLYQHHTVGEERTPDDLFIAFAPVFDVTRAHMTGGSYEAANLLRRDAASDHPLYFTQSGPAVAYLAATPRTIAPGESHQFHLILAAAGLRGDLAWQRAETVRQQIRDGLDVHEAARQRWNRLFHSVRNEDGKEADNARLGVRHLMTRLIVAQPHCGFGERWEGGAAALVLRDGPWQLDPRVLESHASQFAPWRPDIAESLQSTARELKGPLP